MLAGAIALGGCAGPDGPADDPAPATQTPPAASRATSAPPSAAASPSPSPTPTPPGRALPAGQPGKPSVVATDLPSPWGLAFLPDGSALVTSRDEGTVRLIAPDGAVRLVRATGPDGVVPGISHGGEGGLLGVAVPPGHTDGDDIVLYRTTARGNEVVRAALTGTNLGEPRVILGGIPAAGHHNGGQLAFGPDGLLYVTTGDAGQPARSQDPKSLGGKILRVTLDGEPAPGNPTPGSPVWSLGHRNVQGIGWDATGRMYASEFGQNTYDELNLITPGGNYGWPEVEGSGGAGRGFLDPLATWPTSEASPSGLAVTADAVYLAALRGQRLWRVPMTDGQAGEPAEFYRGEFGRLRAVAVGPDGALRLLTNTTDGRMQPRAGDDRLLRIELG